MFPNLDTTYTPHFHPLPPDRSMFNRSAAFYDAIYSFKDYEEEAARIHTIIQEHKRAPGDTLLDVACGTGKHLRFLSRHYQVEGLDLDPGLLEVARRENPGLVFHQGDMTSFDLGRQFDVVTCLFSSIGYAKTLGKMRQTIETLARHLRPDGVLLVEPWFSPDEYQLGFLAARFVDEPELKIARMSISEVVNGVSVLDFHYLVGTPAGIEHFTERHELGLFTREQHLQAFADAGLEATYDPEGLMDRGLYIAVGA